MIAVSTGGLGRSSNIPELLVILKTGDWYVDCCLSVGPNFTCRSGGSDRRILRVSKTRAAMA